MDSGVRWFFGCLFVLVMAGALLAVYGAISPGGESDVTRLEKMIAEAAGFVVFTTALVGLAVTCAGPGAPR